MAKTPIKNLPKKSSTQAGKKDVRNKGKLRTEDLGKVVGGRAKNTTCETDKGDGCDE